MKEKPIHILFHNTITKHNKIQNSQLAKSNSSQNLAAMKLNPDTSDIDINEWIGTANLIACFSLIISKPMLWIQNYFVM